MTFDAFLSMALWQQIFVIFGSIAILAAIIIVASACLWFFCWMTGIEDWIITVNDNRKFKKQIQSEIEELTRC